MRLKCTDLEQVPTSGGTHHPSRGALSPSLAQSQLRGDPGREGLPGGLFLPQRHLQMIHCSKKFKEMPAIYWFPIFPKKQTHSAHTETLGLASARFLYKHGAKGDTGSRGVPGYLPERPLGFPLLVNPCPSPCPKLLTLAIPPFPVRLCGG